MVQQYYNTPDDDSDYMDGGLGAATPQPKPPNAMQLQQMAIQEGAAQLAKAQGLVSQGSGFDPDLSLSMLHALYLPLMF